MTTQVPKSAQMVPLRPGMFEMPDDINGAPRLYGQQCRSCGEMFATTGRVYCANCGEASLERITLSTRGEIYTYTVVHQQLPGALVRTPYVIARVRLPEGVMVQTVLVDVDPGNVRIGMPVEVCLRELKRDDDGRAVVNFFFRPASD